MKNSDRMVHFAEVHVAIFGSVTFATGCGIPRKHVTMTTIAANVTCLHCRRRIRNIRKDRKTMGQLKRLHSSIRAILLAALVSMSACAIPYSEQLALALLVRENALPHRMERMTMRREYEMNEKQLAFLMDACKPVPYILIGGVAPPSARDNAEHAWHTLGAQMGFLGDTAEPVNGKNDHFFTAVPK